MGPLSRAVTDPQLLFLLLASSSCAGAAARHSLPPLCPASCSSLRLQLGNRALRAEQSLATTVFIPLSISQHPWLL